MSDKKNEFSPTEGTFSVANHELVDHVKWSVNYNDPDGKIHLSVELVGKSAPDTRYMTRRYMDKDALMLDLDRLKASTHGVYEAAYVSPPEKEFKPVKLFHSPITSKKAA